MRQIKPAVRTDNIRYAIRDVMILADEVRNSGKEMLYLNIGDPNKYDFKTPMHIIEPISRAMQANQNGYAPSSGIEPARKAIGREADRIGIKNPLDIFITTGASEAIEICLTALVNKGDNVLLPTPGYPLYEAVLAKLEAKSNPYRLNEENDWQPDLADIAGKINKRTRAVVVINPNNPTGSVCDEATLRGVIDLARRHDLVILSDEIYSKLILDDKRHIPIASLDGEASVVTFNGLAKSYLGPGLRTGWGIVSGIRSVLSDYIEAINKILRARLCSHHPSQYAIEPALEGDRTYLAEVIAKLRSRRDLTCRMLNSTKAISTVKPEGAFYAFPRLHVEMSDEEFVKGLLRETGVVVVHGEGFGQMPGTRHFRVVFLPPEDVLERAFEKIIRYAEKLT